jgi:GTPase SAR1 family protein
MHTYARLKDKILEVIERLRREDGSDEAALADLEDRVKKGVFHLLVVGQFKRGKTCLLNALLGVNLLPVSVIPLTSIVTILTYGEELNVEVSFLDGHLESVDPEHLAEFVTEGGNPRNVKGIREVSISYPSPYLKDGVRLIDTPGVGSVYRHNTDVAYQYLPKADAALFLLSVEQPASQAELDFLKDVRRYSGKIFFLLNKIDILSESEIGESLDFAAGVLRETLMTDVRVYPISAKKALEAKMEGAEEGLSRSLLPVFTEVLEGFLLNEKGKVLLLSVTGHLLRLASQMQLERELELKSVAMPLRELEDKIALFELKKREMVQEKDRLDILLDGEVRKVIDGCLDPELETFKTAFLSRMSERFDAFFEDNRERPLKELDKALAEFAVEEVQQAFRVWTVQLEERLSNALDKTCQDLAVKVNDIVESLQAYSSDLFQLPFQRSAKNDKWTARYSLSFRLHEEPVGLEILLSSMTQTIPGLVSRRFQKLRETLFRWARRRIFDSRKSRMLQAIDMQSGQIRYHFLERLQKAKEMFRREMISRIDAAMDGITRAIEAGMNRRSVGEKETAVRQTTLLEQFGKLNEIRNDLMAIRESLSIG